MTNFILVPSRYAEIPAFLKARTPRFACSEDYLMLGGAIDELPGVVLASFGRFLLRLSEATAERAELTSALDAVSEMLDWGDTNTTTAIHDEFFEALETDPSAGAVVQSMMPPPLRHAFDAWAAESR